MKDNVKLSFNRIFTEECENARMQECGLVIGKILLRIVDMYFKH